jgi:hypothetical protein
MSFENKLLEIETLDIKIAQLENSKLEYPLKLAELKEVIGQKEKSRDLTKSNLEKLEKDISSANIDLETHNNELARSHERLTSVKNNKEFDAVQKEIRTRKTVVAETKQSIAKLKEKLPQLQEDFKAAQEEVDGVIAQNSPQIEELTSKIASIDDDIAATTSEKNALCPQVDEDLLKMYDAVLLGRKRSGKVLAHISADSKKCSYCGQVISPNLLKKIFSSAVLVACENCGSLFVLTENAQNQKTS